MALSPEEKQRQTGIIETLVASAAPKRDPGTTIGARGGTGSLSAHFEEWEAEQIQGFKNADVTTQDLQQLETLAKSNTDVKSALDRQKANLEGGALLELPDNTPANKQERDDRKLLANALIESRLVTEKKSVVDTYVGGAENGKSTSVGGDDSMIHQIAGMAGLGGGLFGLLTGFISKIPVVGDYMVAAGLMMGSAVESLLGSIGIGDKDAKFKGFGTALKEVRDSKRFGGGMEAVTSKTGVDAATLLREIKDTAAGNAPAAAAASKPVPKVDTYEVTVAGKAKPLEEKTVADFQATVSRTAAAATDEDTKKALTALNTAIAGDPANAMLKDKDSFMMVTMPDGSFALAAGKIDATGTQQTDTVLLQPSTDGKKLAPAKNAPAVGTLQTGRPLDITTMGLSTEKQANMNTLESDTLADNFKDLKERIGDKAAELNKRSPGLGGVLENMVLLMGDNTKDVLPDVAGMTHMSVLTDDGRVGIVSGAFDAKNDTFSPKKITLMNDDGTFAESVDYKGKTASIAVTPTINGANVVGGLQLKSAAQREAEAKVAGVGVDTIEPRTFSQNLGELLSTSGDKLDPKIANMLKGAKEAFSSNNPDMRFVIMAKPGGERVVVGGKVDGVELKPSKIFEMVGGVPRQTAAPADAKPINIVDGLRVPQPSQTEGFDTAATVSPGPVAKGTTLAEQQSR